MGHIPNWGDKNEMIELVKKEPLLLKCVRSKFKKDRDVVKSAIMEMGDALRYADKSFLSDREMVLLAANTAHDIVTYIPDFWNDIEIMSLIIENSYDDSPSPLKYAGAELKKIKILFIKLLIVIMGLV